MWKRQKPDGAVWDVPLNALPSLYSHHTPQTAYVAIDFEARCTRYGDAIFQMGVAVLPPSALLPQQHDADDAVPDTRPLPPQTPWQIMARHQIHVRTLHITSERYARPWRWAEYREGLRLYEPETMVDEKDMEAYLAALLTSLQVHFRIRLGLGLGAPPLRMVLVGYGMRMEYGILTRSCPAVLSGSFFDAFCDLQLVVDSLRGGRRVQLSLIDALFRLGFPESPFAPARTDKHHMAGNDVVRELVLLLCLLRHAQAQAGAHQQQPQQQARCGRTDALLPHPFQQPGRQLQLAQAREQAARATAPLAFDERRPRPFSQYPFTVSLFFASKRSLGQVAETASALKTHLAAFRPAVATMKRDRTRAWVCFETEDERAQFVQAIHGTPFRQETWCVRVLTVECPPGQPTKHERRTLQDKRRAGNEAVQGTMQHERAAWRAMMAAIEDKGGLGLGWIETADTA